MHLIVSPSYGREYKNKKSILADWQANLDFTCQTMADYGRQINLQDAEMDPNLKTINVRYSNMTKVAVLTKTAKGWRIS
jgi:hypothetical protein